MTTSRRGPTDADLAVVGRPATRQDGAGARSRARPVHGRRRAARDAPRGRAALTRRARSRHRPRSRRGPRDTRGAGGARPGDRGLVHDAGAAARRRAAVRRPADRGRRRRQRRRRRSGSRRLALAIEPLPHVVDPDEALRDQRFTRDPSEEGRGDADAALAAADVRVELQIETPAHLQTPLEPHAAVASWDGDRLTAWISTQGMFAARDELAGLFGIGKDQVRVITEYVGGGFGGKQGAGTEAILAAELARITGRPVRLVNDRHAEQLDGGRRAWTRQSVRLGARRDGTLVAVDADAVISMGQGGWVFPVLVPALTLYRCADVRCMAFPLKTNLRAQNAFRAPGVVEGTTVFEQAIDELALALDLDPLDLRRANHVDVRPARREPVLQQARARLLRPRRRAGGLVGARARCASRRTTACCAAWGAPPRSGGVAVARRRTPPSASTAPGTPSSRRASRTSAPARSPRRGWSRPRSSDWPSTRSGRSAATPRRTCTAPWRAGRRRLPSVMPAVRSAAAKVRKTLLGLAVRRARDRRRRPRRARRPHPVSRRRAGRGRHRGDREARRRDDRRLRSPRAESRRVRGQHLRLPDRAGRRRRRGGRGARRAESSRSTTSGAW